MEDNVDLFDWKQERVTCEGLSTFTQRTRRKIGDGGKEEAAGRNSKRTREQLVDEDERLAKSVRCVKWRSLCDKQAKLGEDDGVLGEIL